MKKTLLFVAFIAFSAMGFSQLTPDGRCIVENQQQQSIRVKVLDQCGDFTITDSDGVTWNLYEQLDLGKTVFLDLFFST